MLFDNGTRRTAEFQTTTATCSRSRQRAASYAVFESPLAASPVCRSRGLKLRSSTRPCHRTALHRCTRRIQVKRLRRDLLSWHRPAAQAGFNVAGTCQQVAGGLDIGSPLTIAAGNPMDQGYVSQWHTRVSETVWMVFPISRYYNTVKSQQHIAAAVQRSLRCGHYSQRPADVCHLLGAWSSSTFDNGPARAANLWHHSSINQATSLAWNHIFSPDIAEPGADSGAAGWRYNELTTIIHRRRLDCQPTALTGKRELFTINDPFGPPGTGRLQPMDL